MTTNENTTAQDQATSVNFHYEIDGKIFGPIAEDEFLMKIIKGELTHENLAWRQGENEWRTIGSMYKLDYPPSLPISHIANGYAITLCILPFLQMELIRYLEKYFRVQFNNIYNYSEFLFGTILFLYFFLTASTLIFLDLNRLEKSGIKINKTMYIIGNIIPTYLFYRGTLIAKATRSKWNISHILAFVWIACATNAFHWKWY